MIKFAAFIMTFERPNEVINTINKLFDQSFPPAKILIIDNSSSLLTGEAIQNLNNEAVEYYRMGYNAGPAGAAKVGLQRLALEGFDWIYWGDDNDPPQNKNTFEDEIKIAERVVDAGIIGEVGVSFNKYTGRTSGFKNKELQEIMDADAVSGGRQMIVSKKVVDKGILPSEKLFFGFEELDFCLKVKQGGFRIIFDGEKIKVGRSEMGNNDPNYKWKGNRNKNVDAIWRQYYSSRNMLSILFRHGFVIAYFYNLFKILFKPFYSLRFGYSYGLKAFKVYWGAILDHLRNRFGIKDFNRL